MSISLVLKPIVARSPHARPTLQKFCIEEVKQYIDSTIAEIDGHTENMEYLFMMDKWSKECELYDIFIIWYVRDINWL